MDEPQRDTTAVRKPTFDLSQGTNRPSRRQTSNNTGTDGLGGATTRTSSRRSEIVRKLTMPPKPVGQAPPLWQGIKAIILMSCESTCTSFDMTSADRQSYRAQCPTRLHPNLGTPPSLVSLPVIAHHPRQWACHFALSESNQHDTLIFVCMYTISSRPSPC